MDPLKPGDVKRFSQLTGADKKSGDWRRINRKERRAMESLQRKRRRKEYKKNMEKLREKGFELAESIQTGVTT